MLGSAGSAAAQVAADHRLVPAQVAVMTGETHIVEWMVGLALALAGFFIGGFRHLSGRITKAEDDAKDGDGTLHERVNRVRDEYARRDDLDKHMSRIDGNVNELRREFREARDKQQEHHDAVMARLSK